MKYLILIATAVIAVLFLFWRDIGNIIPANKLSDAELKTKDLPGKTSFEILRQWDLPDPLREVSGIAWVDEDRFAAVQDENGTVYIFNHRTNKIEKEITFGGAGDYEGIALNGNMAYVVTGGGTIYEIDMQAAEVRPDEYDTPLTKQHNVEGLCYDQVNNRLLLTVKDKDLSSKDYKGIYSFDLVSKQFSSNPVYKIPNDDPVFNDNKKNKRVMPSALGIHPSTKELYITDGPNSRLLILDKNGKPSRLIGLGKKFAQPEGITFSPQGNIYISNEGNNEAGNIIEVRIGQL
jgi:uncharacterized protein YjiK